MARGRRYALLGAHSCQVDADGSVTRQFFDAFDAVVELEDGQHVVIGLRTADYVEREPEPSWPDGYRPLPITLDFDTVRHYDFNEILWLGPDDRSCLIWSNAVGMRIDAIDHLISAREGSALLDGPNGLGLPHPSEVGITVPDDVAWREVGGLANASGTDG